MITRQKFLIVLITCAGWMQLHGQQAKGPVQLADEYFAAGEYYTAAHLYGQYLKPKKQTKSDFPLNIKGKRTAGPGRSASNKSILFKQAESFRLANYWQEAAAAYKEYAEKNSDQRDAAIYWQAICERSLGNYATAEDILNEYIKTADKTNQYEQAAEKELQTLKYIRQQLARADSVLVKIQKLEAVNSSEKGVFAPVHVNGNRFLVSSTKTDTVQANGVNPHHSRLYYATLNNGSLEEMTPAAIPVTDPGYNQGAATISADGKYLYFSQWKKEKENTLSSIFYSVKEGDSWSKPAPLPLANVPNSNNKQPFCSPDGKYLFFASDRPGGSGKSDIWYAPLNSDGSIGEPVNAGKTINTAGDEQAPFYHNSSTTLVFSSNGRQGMGGYDLFSAKGNETSWKPAENLGHPVNSSRDDIYFFAPENKPLLSNAIFSSDRGTGCCLETYHITKASKAKLISGTLRDCTDNSPLANADVILKDSSDRQWRMSTDENGKYMFELPGGEYSKFFLTINKEPYLEKTSIFTLENADVSDLLIDKLVNTDLCMEKKPEDKPEEPEPLVIKAEDVVTVYFDFDRSLLKSEAVNKMDSIYTMMIENPIVTIQISGYTDGLGSDEYNNKLSDRRARACADYLVKKGIDAKRIRFVSFGKCCPVEMEKIDGRDNPDGRSRNRRALINVKKD